MNDDEEEEARALGLGFATMLMQSAYLAAAVGEHAEEAYLQPMGLLYAKLYLHLAERFERFPHWCAHYVVVTGRAWEAFYDGIGLVYKS